MRGTSRGSAGCSFRTHLGVGYSEYSHGVQAVGQQAARSVRISEWGTLSTHMGYKPWVSRLLVPYASRNEGAHPAPHLRRDEPGSTAHICTGTSPPSLGWGLPLPHLCLDSMGSPPHHICSRTGLVPPRPHLRRDCACLLGRYTVCFGTAAIVSAVSLFSKSVARSIAPDALQKKSE
jgi:hypothetical protein